MSPVTHGEVEAVIAAARSKRERAHLTGVQLAHAYLFRADLTRANLADGPDGSSRA